MLVVWRIVLVVLATLVAWRIVVTGVSAYQLQFADEEDTTGAGKVVASDPRRPEAQYQRALGILEQDPARAAELLKRSYAGNPGVAAPLLALAHIAEGDGDHQQAAALVEKASQLMPVNPNIQLKAGNFWASRGNLGAAMNHWARALEAHQATSAGLFPVLLKLAEEPQTRSLFQPLAASPPSWWERFFGETARRALDLETVRTLYAFRRSASDAPVTREERDLYVRRLQKEGKITEAYLVWINGLDEAERSHLGILYNGSFEVEPTSSGFDWHLRAADRVTITTAATAGTWGARALHLLFRNREERFWHVHQPLFLDPGFYRLDGMVRTDNLDSQGGLKCVIRCLRPEASELTESERFLGSSEWRAFSFELQVPDDCTAQEIRLVSAGRRDFEHTITGGIWFDRMSIRKVPALAAKTAVSVADDGRSLGPPAPAFSEEVFNALQVSGTTGFTLRPLMIESLENVQPGNE